MIRILAALTAAVQLMCAGPGPSRQAAALLKSGTLMRMHVIAQDNTPAMQALKLTVRDAVQEAYRASAGLPGETMLEHTRRTLGDLRQAAESSARGAGYEGKVSVVLGIFRFDQREMDGLVIPAGEYPALVVTLGEGRGRNWWGLIDPDAAFGAAGVSTGTGEIRWDWSLAGFLSVLLGIDVTGGEGDG